jgi:hypothetical protein
LLMPPLRHVMMVHTYMHIVFIPSIRYTKSVDENPLIIIADLGPPIVADIGLHLLPELDELAAPPIIPAVNPHFVAIPVHRRLRHSGSQRAGGSFCEVAAELARAETGS